MTCDHEPGPTPPQRPRRQSLLSPVQIAGRNQDGPRVSGGAQVSTESCGGIAGQRAVADVEAIREQVACPVLDSYIYGFALQEASLPFDLILDALDRALHTA